MTRFDADALIIGAGPVGLFQAFQLGLQGLSAVIADVLPMAGGQCAALYPTKLIHDIPALPACTGDELTQRLLTQIQPFAPTFLLGHEVAGFTPLDADAASNGICPGADNPIVDSPNAHASPSPRGFRVTLNPVGRGAADATAAPRELTVRFIFIAAGVGAFQPKPLRVPGLEAWLGRQVFQHTPEWLQPVGEAPVPATIPAHVLHLVVYGAEEEALDTMLALRPLALAQPQLRISLVHRKEALHAEPAVLDAFAKARHQGLLHFELGQPTGCVSEGTGAHGRLTTLQLSDANDQTREIPVDIVLARQGLSPKLGPLADWGLALARKQIPVDTAAYATSLPGVYAVGDINTYPGKRKLILCGFHEATLAAFDAASVLAGSPVPLEYTTSSARLQQRLGVNAGVATKT